MLFFEERSFIIFRSTLFLAGHDTTAVTASWVLYRLSLHKEYQTLVRDEVRAARAASQTRGDEELTIADLESMKFLVAALKVTCFPIFHYFQSRTYISARKPSVLILSPLPLFARQTETMRFHCQSHRRQLPGTLLPAFPYLVVRRW